MRPVLLTVQAFGPYAGVQEFDFRQLGERRLFLIHGPTGSGKTSVLDGMCYALFGCCSGDDRDTSRIHSDHADAEIPCSSTFDFTIGADLYRVRRVADHERPKKKGKGTIKEEKRATLWRNPSGEGDATIGQVLATKWSTVTEEVERLFGLEAAQFRQVVVLPQGQFRRLLTSKTTEREEILKVLFQSQLYEAITRSLKEEHRSLENEWHESQSVRAGVLSQHSSQSAEELAKRLHDAEETLVTLSSSIADADGRAAASAIVLQEARATDERFRERSDAERGVDEARKHYEAAAPSRDELSRARQAAPLVPLLDALTAREQEALTARKAHETAVIELTNAISAAEEKRQALVVASERIPERDRSSEMLQRLSSIIPAFEQLANALAARDSCEKEAGQARDDLAAAEREAEELRRQLQALVEEGTKSRSAAATQESLRLDVARLTDLHEARQGLDECLRDEETVLASLSRAQAHHAGAEVSLVEASSQRESLEAASRAGRAVILAESLLVGVPCPVCGSLEHPSPAEGSEAFPSDDAVDAARQAEVQARDERDVARSALSDVEIEVARVRERRTNLQLRLGVHATNPPETLAALLHSAEAALEVAIAASARAAEVDEECLVLRERVSAAEATVQELLRRRDEAQSGLASAAAIVAEREGNVPEPYRAPGVAERENAQLLAVISEISNTIKSAEASAHDAEQQLRVAQSACDIRRTASESADAAVASERLRMEERLASEQFASTADLRNAARSAEYCTRLESQSQALASALGAAEARLQRAIDATGDLERPDIEAAQVAHDEARETANTLRAQHGRLSSSAAQMRVGVASLTELKAKADQLESQQRIVGALADAASGRNPHSLSLQRYVLATSLDEVLELASRRLRQMSRNRYDLRRVREASDRRASAGLDLEVYDDYTGTSRPTGNLSGGESFLAALALSLGLTDVVQAHAGGVRLDTLFIDEGFGTLDPEALDQALEMLVQLQEGGRLVGIISHVPELRERIDARLEVMPGERGSRATFRVG